MLLDNSFGLQTLLEQWRIKLVLPVFAWINGQACLEQRGIGLWWKTARPNIAI